MSTSILICVGGGGGIGTRGAGGGVVFNSTRLAEPAGSKLSLLTSLQIGSNPYSQQEHLQEKNLTL